MCFKMLYYFSWDTKSHAITENSNKTQMQKSCFQSGSISCLPLMEKKKKQKKTHRFFKIGMVFQEVSKLYCPLNHFLQHMCSTLCSKMD